jgi:hypothetical protein
MLGPMTRARKTLRAIYFALAALALIACWNQNFAFQRANRLGTAETFIEFWPALLANHATTSITIDIFLLAVAAMIWMVLEARRLGVRYVWAYVVLGVVLALSVTFPLFLAAREARLEAAGDPGPRATTLDVLALALLSVPALGLSLWTLIP